MIRSVEIAEKGENPLNDNTDVTVHLTDGRSYAFTAYTPLNLMSMMDREEINHFLSPDMLVLREISEQNIRDAVSEMLEDDEIDRYGILQEPG